MQRGEDRNDILDKVVSRPLATAGLGEALRKKGLS